MRSASLLALACLGGPVLADAETEARARAALALASAERTRAVPPAPPCLTDWNGAFLEARRRGCPLYLWVGMGPNPRPDLRGELPGVHLAYPNNAGDSTPRLLAVDAITGEAFGRVSAVALTADSLQRLRNMRPPIRADPGLVPSLSVVPARYYPPTVYYGTQTAGGYCGPVG